MNGLTITGWTGTGNNTGNGGGVALSVQNGSGFQLSNFSVSGYNVGIRSDQQRHRQLNRRHRPKGIIKDIGTLSTNGTSGIASSITRP